MALRWHYDATVAFVAIVRVFKCIFNLISFVNSVCIYYVFYVLDAFWRNERWRSDTPCIWQ